MVLYCWRNGQLGIARQLPSGAIEFARGGGMALAALLVLARDARQPRGVDRLSGMVSWLDDAEAREVLGAQMRRLEGLVGSAVVFNSALDMRFAG